jgi:hypothetical protein
MAEFNRHSRSRRVFRPVLARANDGAAALDRRVLPSGGKDAHAGIAVSMPEPAIAAPRGALALPAVRHAKRLPPMQEINAQYAAFLAAFREIENLYVATLGQTSNATVPVTATVTAPYVAGSPTMQVDDAAVFGPPGTFPTPVSATAFVGSVNIGHFIVTGSSGNLLTINVSASSQVPLAAGTTLTANVPTSASTSAAMIFPSFITNSTVQLATRLVKYFNNVPITLPRKITPPHQPQQTGAIQEFVYRAIAGPASTSLQQLLLAIPLPTTPGPELVEIYDAAVNDAINASRLQVLTGVQQIWAGNIKIPGQPPSTTTTTSGTSPTTA